MRRLAASIVSRTTGGAPLGAIALPSTIVAPQVALVRSAAETKGLHSNLLGPIEAVAGETTTTSVAIATIAAMRRSLTRRA